MIELIRTRDNKAIQEMLRDAFHIFNSDSLKADKIEDFNFTVDDDTKYFLFIKDSKHDTIVGILMLFTIDPKKDLTVSDIHVYIKKQYRGNRIVKYFLALLSYLEKNTPIKKIIASIPITRRDAIRRVKEFGFKYMLSSSNFIYKNKVGIDAEHYLFDLE